MQITAYWSYKSAPGQTLFPLQALPDAKGSLTHLLFSHLNYRESCPVVPSALDRKLGKGKVSTELG